MGGGPVQVFADFDEMAWSHNVMMTRTAMSIVGREQFIRMALVIRDGTPSIPGSFANDDFANRRAFVGPFSVTDQTNIGYSGEVGEVDCVTESGPGPDMASAWFLFTPTTTANHDITTAGSDFDTTLAIYLDAPTLAEVMAAGVIDCNDDGGPGATSLMANVPLVAGVPYAIRVDGFLGDQGTYDLDVQLS